MKMIHTCFSTKPHRRRRFSSIGFTLVELLVVIAIIGILIGMLLPAVQAIRETARRCACANQVAQLGMAVHNYEYSMETLPPGVTDPNGPIASVELGQHIGFIVHLLPYMEQTAIANNFDISIGAYGAANAAARAQEIELLICPSFHVSANNAGTAGATNYAGCHHGSEAPIDADNNGVLFRNSAIAYDDITDGGSNTILIGEFLPFSRTLGWASGTRSSLRNTGTFMKHSDWLLADRAPLPPPNTVGGFGSMHPAGAQFCMAGGEVRFISTMVDPKVFSNLGNRADGVMTGRFK